MGHSRVILVQMRRSDAIVMFVLVEERQNLVNKKEVKDQKNVGREIR